MEYIGGASGAVLGYTAYNIPGAVVGYKMGKAAMKRRYASRSTQTPYAKAGRKRSIGTQTRSGKSVNVDGVTQQKDDRTLYRKHRMPKRLRKRWKKFINKVHAVEIQDRGLQIIKYNPTIAGPTTIAAGAQNFKAVHLYGCSSNGGDTGAQDLLLLSKDIQAQSASWIKRVGGDVNLTIQDTENKVEVRMQSAHLDLFIQNTSATPLLFEIYHLWYVKNNNAPSFGDAFNWIEAKEAVKQEWDGTTLTNLTSINLNQFGATLFDDPQLISKAGCTVRSVKEIYLGPDAIHHQQIRDSKNHNIDLMAKLAQLGSTSGYADPKLTETFLVVCKNPSVSNEGSYIVRGVRTYRYTIEGVKQVASGYVAA